MNEKQEYLVYRGESQDVMYRAGTADEAAAYFATRRGAIGEVITVKQRGTNKQWEYIIGQDIETGAIYASPFPAA